MIKWIKYVCSICNPLFCCFSRSAFGKPQFGPWLIEQVESGKYEGLRMIGNDIFRIPWKHNSRRDLGDDDVKIFKVTSSLRQTPFALFHFCVNDSCHSWRRSSKRAGFPKGGSNH